MAEAGNASVFRVTDASDTEANAKLDTNGIVEMNNDADTPDGNTFMESMTISWTEDISIHPNPGRALNQVQANGLGTKIVTIKGYIKNDSPGAPVTFDAWMEESKDNTNFPYGRFGIRNDNMSSQDFTPTATTGYILQNIELIDVPEFENRLDFIMVLYRSGSV